ncbi:MAG: thioredoxin-disulfide reductase [Myxococcales bacterium]|jgi:thioredoxin reductase (NADPH)|nr:thioredoxin-disulfide reductase [Myxococcales bacterium]
MSLSETSTSSHSLVIIGSGPAGCTAAIYAARAGLDPLLITGAFPNLPGGQLTTTSEIENFPGFPEGIQGAELMERMRAQAERLGTTFVDDNVDRLDLGQGGRPFQLHLSERSEPIVARAVILATGAEALWLGAKGEELYKNRGVSACATCDGFFFRGADVIVVGGGDAAMEEADFLSKLARHVTLIHRREGFRASKAMLDRVLANPKISVESCTLIDEVVGDGKRMTGARLKSCKDGSLRDIDAQGMFVAIGRRPNTALVKDLPQVELDELGYLKVAPGTSHTSVPGLFAAGDACDPIYRQAIAAAASGCRAALDAKRFLSEVEKPV